MLRIGRGTIGCKCGCVAVSLLEGAYVNQANVESCFVYNSKIGRIPKYLMYIWGCTLKAHP